MASLFTEKAGREARAGMREVGASKGLTVMAGTGVFTLTRKSADFRLVFSREKTGRIDENGGRHTTFDHNSSDLLVSLTSD